MKKPSKIQAKVGKVMKEFKAGTLHSGKGGKVVKNPKQAIAISTKDAMNILEKYWREKMADEIENFRVETCRCELTLKPNCEALADAIEILNDTTHLVSPIGSTSDTIGTDND